MDAFYKKYIGCVITMEGEEMLKQKQKSRDKTKSIYIIYKEENVLWWSILEQDVLCFLQNGI